MADKQSREERIEELIKRVIRNGDGLALSELNTMGISVEFTDEGVRWRDMKVKEGDPDVEYIGDKPKFKGLTVKVDVDVSEALTGLKALQREAREATKALRELEEAQKRSQVLPRVPFVGHPNTSSDIHPHIKKYDKWSW